MQRIKNLLGRMRSFICGYWREIAIAILFVILMGRLSDLEKAADAAAVNAADAADYASEAYDAANDARDFAEEASDNAESAADSAQDAASNAIIFGN